MHTMGDDGGDSTNSSSSSCKAFVTMDLLATQAVRSIVGHYSQPVHLLPPSSSSSAAQSPPSSRQGVDSPARTGATAAYPAAADAIANDSAVDRDAPLPPLPRVQSVISSSSGVVAHWSRRILRGEDASSAAGAACRADEPATGAAGGSEVSATATAVAAEEAAVAVLSTYGAHVRPAVLVGRKRRRRRVDAATTDNNDNDNDDEDDGSSAGRVGIEVGEAGKYGHLVSRRYCELLSELIRAASATSAAAASAAAATTPITSAGADEAATTMAVSATNVGSGTGGEDADGEKHRRRRNRTSGAIVCRSIVQMSEDVIALTAAPSVLGSSSATASLDEDDEEEESEEKTDDEATRDAEEADRIRNVTLPSLLDCLRLSVQLLTLVGVDVQDAPRSDNCGADETTRATVKEGVRVEGRDALIAASIAAASFTWGRTEGGPNDGDGDDDGDDAIGYEDDGTVGPTDVCPPLVSRMALSQILERTLSPGTPTPNPTPDQDVAQTVTFRDDDDDGGDDGEGNTAPGASSSAGDGSPTPLRSRVPQHWTDLGRIQINGGGDDDGGCGGGQHAFLTGPVVNLKTSRCRAPCPWIDPHANAVDDAGGGGIAVRSATELLRSISAAAAKTADGGADLSGRGTNGGSNTGVDAAETERTGTLLLLDGIVASLGPAAVSSAVRSHFFGRGLVPPPSPAGNDGRTGAVIQTRRRRGRGQWGNLIPHRTDLPPILGATGVGVPGDADEAAEEVLPEQRPHVQIPSRLHSTLRLITALTSSSSSSSSTTSSILLSNLLPITFTLIDSNDSVEQSLGGAALVSLLDSTDPNDWKSYGRAAEGVLDLAVRTGCTDGTALGVLCAARVRLEFVLGRMLLADNDGNNGIGIGIGSGSGRSDYVEDREAVAVERMRTVTRTLLDVVRRLSYRTGLTPQGDEDEDNDGGGGGGQASMIVAALVGGVHPLLSYLANMPDFMAASVELVRPGLATLLPLIGWDHGGNAMQGRRVQLAALTCLEELMVGSHPVVPRHGGKIMSELLACLGRLRRDVVVFKDVGVCGGGAVGGGGAGMSTEEDGASIRAVAAMALRVASVCLVVCEKRADSVLEGVQKGEQKYVRDLVLACREIRDGTKNLY